VISTQMTKLRLKEWEVELRRMMAVKKMVMLGSPFGRILL